MTAQIYVKQFHYRFRRQNDNSDGYGSPTGAVLEESETTEKTNAPIEIAEDTKDENVYESPEVKQLPEPEIKPIPDISENTIIENEGVAKKYVPQVKLVEEPETPPMTTPSTPSSTASEPLKKEVRTYKPLVPVEAKEAPEDKEDEYINPLLDKKFPNFFTRFQKIFGDTRSSFFVKL